MKYALLVLLLSACDHATGPAFCAYAHTDTTAVWSYSPNGADSVKALVIVQTCGLAR